MCGMAAEPQRRATGIDPEALKTHYEREIEARAARDGDTRHSGRTFRGMLKASKALPSRGLASDEGLWVWSDLHLGHGNIIRYADRPFADVPAMNATLWRNWEVTVGDSDTLIFVGDIAMRDAVAEVTWQRIRAAPGARKLLVFGNHDLTGGGDIRVDGFDEICSVLCVDGDPPLVLTHLPLREIPPGHVNVHGHTHNEAPRRSAHINVSVEQLDYRPVALGRLRGLARQLLRGHIPDGATTAGRERSHASATCTGSTPRRPPTRNVASTTSQSES